jgi:hypothetical protein
LPAELTATGLTQGTLPRTLEIPSLQLNVPG